MLGGDAPDRVPGLDHVLLDASGLGHVLPQFLAQVGLGLPVQDDEALARAAHGLLAQLLEGRGRPGQIARVPRVGQGQLEASQQGGQGQSQAQEERSRLGGLGEVFGSGEMARRTMRFRGHSMPFLWVGLGWMGFPLPWEPLPGRQERSGESVARQRVSGEAGAWPLDSSRAPEPFSSGSVA